MATNQGHDNRPEKRKQHPEKIIFNQGQVIWRSQDRVPRQPSFFQVQLFNKNFVKLHFYREILGLRPSDGDGFWTKELWSTRCRVWREEQRTRPKTSEAWKRVSISFSLISHFSLERLQLDWCRERDVGEFLLVPRQLVKNQLVKQMHSVWTRSK